jgi:glycosyltransferase involved in cell wall biosynthesis
LEAYIEDNVHNYDLVVTHNNIFRPAVFAMDAAKRKGVPAILWPHSHFDDDYYHFPDVLQSAQSARLVLAAPKAACDFLSEQGCDARYLPNGIDTAEPFTTLDIEHFRKVHSSAKPFVLVLGRKAGAKNYKDVIAAVEQFNGDHGELDVVLIGPDDDGVKIDSPVATYLGRQPREVVRGALISCLTLVNMSSSESFGIVLLEAWLAGTAVIANKQCAAFHDIAVDESNALLVEKRDLKNALLRLHESAELRTRLAQNGRKTAAQYDSAIVRARFIEFCHEAMGAASI